MSQPAKPAAPRPSAMDRAAFVATFGQVFEHSPWIARGAFDLGLPADADSPEGLHRALCAVLRGASAAEQRALIDAHPDLAGRLAQARQLTASSSQEQAGAGLDRLTDQERARFTALNDAYRARFGFPFVLAIKGRSKAEIQAAFERRLEHDQASEQRIALAEIERIALFRLMALLPSASAALRLTIWNEFRHERANPTVGLIYPDGIHAALAAPLRAAGHVVRTATLDEPEHGLGEGVLEATDVLLWWGHQAHAEVRDEIVDRVQARVLQGMGLIALHSAHFSKIFKRLMGTGCDLKWREAGERERLWVVAPGHPIVSGLPERIDLEHEEMYGEHFDIPTPDELVFLSWFQGGEVFRSGCCFRRGAGRVFYFRPGHETYPTYHEPLIQQVIQNAVRWAAPLETATPKRGRSDALEQIG